MNAPFSHGARTRGISAPAPHSIEAGDIESLASAFAARAAEHDRSGHFPGASLADAGDAGLHALTVPVALGGQGAGLAATVQIARRLGAADPAATLILAMTWIQHAHAARERRWPHAIYAQVVRDAVAGRGLINALRVEPELGSPARGGLPATVARRTADGWSLSGRKIYSTGAPGLRWMYVFARTDEAEPRLGFFLVPGGAGGIRIDETWDHLGMRATASHDVVFEQAAVPVESGVDLRRPEEWRAMTAVQSAWTCLTVAAIYLGVADAARAWLVQFLNARVPTNLGRPLASLERMQIALGEIDALRHAAAAALEATAARADADPDNLAPSEPGLVKQIATGNAIRAVEAAVALAGNPALSRGNPLERHLRDVLCARIHTPQHDSALKAAGLAALQAAH